MKKLIKLKRYWLARIRPNSCSAFFWHIGRPNFGDDINPSFFEKLTGRCVRLEVHRNRPHFLGMGSILEKATADSVALGSGFINSPDAPVKLPGNLIALRGRLSRECITNCPDVLLGDPMVLLSEIYKPLNYRKTVIGIVPHVSQVKAFRRLALSGVVIIDPADEPWRVIQAIAECRYIMSQSLHGLIVADALEVPNLWITPAEIMIGGDFKFLDYFSTLDHPKRPHQVTRELLVNPPLGSFSVGRYLFSKSVYKERLCEVISK